MRLTISVFLLTLAATASADANGGGRVAYYRPAYYYYEPCGQVVYYQPWAVQPPVLVMQAPQPATPAPQPSIRQFAPQAPAPASAEQIWAAPREKPEVTEFRSSQSEPVQVKYYDAYYVAATPGVVKETCSIAFWNLADRAVQLRVGDKTHTVQRQQQVTLDLPRQFQWQIEGRNPEPVLVAQDQGAMEIVIRR